MKTFKPMLAAGKPRDMGQEAFDNSLRFPVYATPKIDGIRCSTIDAAAGPDSLSLAVCRSLKQVPNHYVRRLLRDLPPGLDGELVVPGKFCDTASAIMRHEGEPDFEFNIFDFFLHDAGYCDRIQHLVNNVSLDATVAKVKVLGPVELTGLEDLYAYEKKCLEEHYEGIIIRTAQSPYKFGRSTLREQWMVKIKRFTDEEAVVVGVEPLYHNANTPMKNHLGYQERSSHQANMVAQNCMGKLIVKCPSFDSTFSIGTGFTDIDRVDLWKDKPIGKTVKFKYQAHGTKNVPRTPVFIGFRDGIDMDVVAPKLL